MVSNEMRGEAVLTIRECWPEGGQAVIDECNKVARFEGTCKDFLSHCTACGGNWGGMLLTGIKELWPNVYEAIPDDMGPFAFTCLCKVLNLCGVDTSES